MNTPINNNQPPVDTPEPAEVFLECAEKFNRLPMAVQIAVANNVTMLLKRAFEATSEKTFSPELTQPLGLCANMVSAMLRCTDRAFVLRRSEACMRFYQKSTVLKVHGESDVDIIYTSPLPGKGDTAEHMAKTAFNIINNISQELGKESMKKIVT